MPVVAAHLSDGGWPGSVHTLSATPSVPIDVAALRAIAATSGSGNPKAAAAPAICKDETPRQM